jgi:hypothetical protein
MESSGLCSVFTTSLVTSTNSCESWESRRWLLRCFRERDVVEVEFSLQPPNASTIMEWPPQKSALFARTSGVVIAGLIETPTAATCLGQTPRTTFLLPCTLLSRQNLHFYTHTNTKSSKYGRRSASIASSGGANPRNSATRQITDIEVLQQAEQSLQKASGGFSFFGGRQDKCTAR